MRPIRVHRLDSGEWCCHSPRTGTAYSLHRTWQSAMDRASSLLVGGASW